MIYTHEIIWFKKIKCFIYKNVKEKNGEIYIGTEDGRACWWKKSEVKKIKSTFVNCFKIAKKHKGVLYWSRNSYGYSPVRDFFGELIFDFRTTNRYGIMELPKEDRKSFYKVDK